MVARGLPAASRLSNSTASRRGDSAGLSTQDLDGIRTTLASGRKPRVVFTAAAGQIAGQAGQVVALRDPTDDEWVVVRFGRDELPFSPIDLAVPRRAPAKRAPADRTSPPTPVAPKPATIAATQVGTPPHAPAAPRVSTPPITEIPPQRQESPMPTSTPSTVDAITPTQLVDAPAGGSDRPVRKSAAPKQPRVKTPPSLTVTLSYTDGDWFVGAQQGSKSLAKPYVIKAGEALRMVGLLDVPGVHEAVEQIIAAERSEVNAQAERLRAELADIEARLADLPELT